MGLYAGLFLGLFQKLTGFLVLRPVSTQAGAGPDPQALSAGLHFTYP